MYALIMKRILSEFLFFINIGYSATHLRLIFNRILLITCTFSVRQIDLKQEFLLENIQQHVKLPDSHHPAANLRD